MKSHHRAFTLVELGLVMALIAILAAILFPVFAQARKSAVKSQCGEHLYQIGLALQLYARDHDSHLPPRHNDLGPITRSYLRDLSCLECGSDVLAPQVDKANASAASGERLYSSYQYRGGLTSDDRPDIPVAADWALFHEGGATVLNLSGSVKWLRAGNVPPVSFGPRVLPPGAVPPQMLSPMPFLNDPPAKPGSGGSAPGGGGE